MPVCTQIAAAAAMFRQNEAFLPKGIQGLTAEDWTRRPNGTTNSILWTVGHMAWARERTMHFLGVERSTPSLSQFARGNDAAQPASSSTPEEILTAWKDVAAALSSALEAASPELLSAPAPEKAPPSIDGTVGGVVCFMAYHDTYHFGQAAYICRWLGGAQLMG